ATCFPEEPTLKSIADRLDHISSSLDTLASFSTPKRDTGSCAATARKSANNEENSQFTGTSANKPSRSVSFARSKNQSLDPNITSAGSTAHQPVVPVHTPFADRLDNTINDVLSCIRRGNDEQIFCNLKSKLLTSLDALPPPSAQIMNSAEELAPQSKSPIRKTPKRPRKREMSSGLLEELDKLIASSPTGMRFTPLANQYNDQEEEFSNPEFLSLDRSGDIELNRENSSFVENEARINACREVKRKPRS
ncbi:hypothetical protein FGIG_12269, partial [Fasciola gigantica]